MEAILSVFLYVTMYWPGMGSVVAARYFGKAVPVLVSADLEGLLFPVPVGLDLDLLLPPDWLPLRTARLVHHGSGFASPRPHQRPMPR